MEVNRNEGVIHPCFLLDEMPKYYIVLALIFELYIETLKKLNISKFHQGRGH